MSGTDSNPVADPDLINPFQDPSVSEARRTMASRGTPAALEEYNPFSENQTAAAPRAAVTVATTQPAIMKPSEEPPAYSQPQEAPRASAELLRRQEELEMKAAELDRREREMLSASGGRRNNWPPLPDQFPVGPCFYHDVSVEIPVQFQRTVRTMYYLWMCHTGTLLANLIGCLAWLCVDPVRGVDLGLSILWLLLFTPCSFVCWYRPLYAAFRSDSSFRFFIFFFIYICQFGVYVLQCIGITGWGASGWISALTGLNKSVPVGIIMIAVAALFTALAVVSLIMFKKVHALYRTTGASFHKAQQEFASGVMSNQTVRTAAATAVTTAAQEGLKEHI